MSTLTIQIKKDLMSDLMKPYRKKDLFGFRDIFGYYFRWKDPDKKPDFNLHVMHIINRISIIIFIIALIIIVIRRILG